MHLLESGVNLIYIRDFLGHSSVITTEIYAKTNPEIKRRYLEKAASNIDISVNKFSEKEKETVFCKHFLHKVAKSFCRLLHLHFVGDCKAVAGRCIPATWPLQIYLSQHKV